PDGRAVLVEQLHPLGAEGVAKAGAVLGDDVEDALLAQDCRRIVGARPGEQLGPRLRRIGLRDDREPAPRPERAVPRALEAPDDGPHLAGLSFALEPFGDHLVDALAGAVVLVAVEDAVSGERL